MSGIGAIFYKTGQPAGREAATRMARSLAEYGRHRQAISLSGCCSLSYAHFINTPQSINETQPVEGPQSGYILVFDGRLDNRKELIEAIGLPTNLADTIPDSNLALKTIETWGHEAIQRWVGEFAVIVWNNTDRTLFAAVDQLGRRSLNYHDDPEKLVIASSPKAIFPAAGIDRQLDELKLSDALGQFYHDGERTFFRGIKRLMGAHQMLVTPQASRISRYWDIKDSPDISYRQDASYAEHGLEVFKTAVRSMMRSAGEVGSFMSGGLDSPSVAVTATHCLPEDQQFLQTFTWVPEADWDKRAEWYCHGDETPFVEAITSLNPKIRLNFVDAAGLGLYHKLEEYLDAAEAPARNTLNMTWGHAILEEASKRGIRTMLDGGMGNMTLSWSGQDTYLHWLRTWKMGKLAREIWMTGGRKPRSALGLAWRQIAVPYLPEPLLRRWKGRHETLSDLPVWQRYSFINPQFAAKHGLAKRAAEFGFDYFDKPVRDARVYRAQLLTTGLSNEAATSLQAYRSLYGVETRDPMADRRVVEWAMGIPRDQYLGNGQSRWLIKRMMAGLLPEKILHNTSKGRQTVDWHSRMTRDLPRLKEDLRLLTDSEEDRRMFDMDRMTQFVDDWPQQTVTDTKDDRRILLPVNLPATIAIMHFKRRIEGRNR